MGHKWMWNADARRAAAGRVPGRCRSRCWPEFARSSAGAYATSDQIAGHASAESGPRSWACAPEFPFPTGAFDAHWDAIGAGCRIGDVVNVVGTSTCIMAIADEPALIPGRLRRGARIDPSRQDRHRGGTLGYRRHFRCHRAARRHDGRRALEGTRKLPRRANGIAPPDLGQRRPHGAGQSRTERHHARLATSRTRRRTNCSRPSKARHSTRASFWSAWKSTACRCAASSTAAASRRRTQCSTRCMPT